MDVERTIEYILHLQAKAEARADRADERMDKFDKRLEATRKLVEAGMKLVVKSERDRIASKKDFDRRMTQMDAKIDRLIDSWGKQRSNGHK